MKNNAKKKSLLILITILALFFLPLISQAQVFPSDAVTKSEIVQLDANGAYSILSTGDYTILAVYLQPLGANEYVALGCGTNWIWRANNSWALSEVSFSLIQFFCENNYIDLHDGVANQYVKYSITYISRDIANTDDPRLMPVQLTDFYDTANQGLKLLIFWVQIGIIAWFFLVVVLYRFFWKWLGFGRFFRN